MMDKIVLSIIIPTLNEAENIAPLIHHLRKNIPLDKGNNVEIIVVDAQSTDKTVALARQAGAQIVVSELGSRAVQMNLGAQHAKGDIFYFVHADCLPPATYFVDIQRFVAEKYDLGCYRYRFKSAKFLLKINAYFTRFSPLWCRGGDETLFVTRKSFEILRGYNPHYCIMEEYDFIKRAWQAGFHFKIMPNYALVSARKYETNSWLRVQFANATAFKLFRQGASPAEIKAKYRAMLDYR